MIPRVASAASEKNRHMNDCESCVFVSCPMQFGKAHEMPEIVLFLVFRISGGIRSLLTFVLFIHHK